MKTSTLLLSTATAVYVGAVGPARGDGFAPVNLVSDNNTLYPAVVQDVNLVNPWGVSFSATSPFWVSDNGSGRSSLYRIDPVTDAPTIQNLVVTIPGAGNVTGTIFNPQAGAGALNGDLFLFASEDGTVSGWRSSLASTAETMATTPGGAYKGATFGAVNSQGNVYLANFGQNRIDVMNGVSLPLTLTGGGSFTDPNLPAGYAPFNIRNLNGTLYVTYALKEAVGIDDVPGPGNGIVDAFDLNGNFLRRVASGGSLNSPWGLAIAPSSFGALAGDLLVGNFGDGRISAFDLNGDVFEGLVPGTNGAPLVIEGLWTLTTGNGGNGGSADKLYYTAGPADETHGVLGLLAGTVVPGAPVPDNGSVLLLLSLSMGGLLAGRKKLDVALSGSRLRGWRLDAGVVGDIEERSR